MYKEHRLYYVLVFFIERHYFGKSIVFFPSDYSCGASLDSVAVFVNMSEGLREPVYTCARGKPSVN